MKFGFRIEVGVEAEIESIVPSELGTIEVTLSANGRSARCFVDVEQNDHGTLEVALLALLGYRREDVGQRPSQAAPQVSAQPQRVM